MPRVGKPNPKTRAKVAREKRAVLSLVQNRSLFELFKAVEAKWTKRWRLSKTQAEREDCWALLHGLDALYVEMKARIDRGTVQEQQDQAVARKESGERAEQQSPVALDKRKR